jgi:hypothetical protein
VQNFYLAYQSVLGVLRIALFALAVLLTIVCAVDWAMRTRRLSPFGPIARFFRSNVDPMIASVERRLVRAGGRRVMPLLIHYIRERRLRRERWVGALEYAGIPLLLVSGLEDPVSGGSIVARWRELLPSAPVGELPGVGQNDIEVMVDDDLLTIRGEKKIERDEKQENFLVVERATGAFMRTIRLPFPVDPSAVQADYDNGVLTVTWPQVWKTSVLYLVIAILHWVFRKQFFAISFEPQRARAGGMAIRWWDFLFYALFGLVVTSFVQIGGVLLVFSYLIVPAVCAILLASSFRMMLLAGWLVATLGGIAGLFASWHFNFPTGSAIVCMLGIMLVGTGLITSLFKRAG